MVYQDLALVEPQDISHQPQHRPGDPAQGPARLAGLRRPQGDAQALGGRARPARRAHRADDPPGRDALRRPAPGGGPGPQRDPGLRRVPRRAAARRAHRRARLRADQAGRGADPADGRRRASRSCSSPTTCPLCEEVADRVVVLNRGQKVADVPVAEHRDRPHRRLDHRRPGLEVRRGPHEPAPVIRRALPAARGDRLVRAADVRSVAGGEVRRVHAVARRGAAPGRADRGPDGSRSARSGAGACVHPRRRGPGQALPGVDARRRVPGR